MNKTVLLKRNLFIFGIPVLIMISMVLLTKSPAFLNHTNKLSVAITADLLLIVPFIYFLLIRKTAIPKTTVVPFVILGVVICSFIIPKENQDYLNLFKSYILPVIELTVVAFIIYNLRKAIKQFKTKKTESYDFYSTLKKTCYEILPKGVVIPFAMEISVFYYGFIYWKKRALQPNEFSYHKDSGALGLLIALLFLIAIETVALHLLLAQWSATTAWVLTLLSIYSGIQILGFLKSIIKRPIAIANGKLYLRYGVMKETTIVISNIESIKISYKDVMTDENVHKLSILGDLEGHNLVLRLKEENELIGFYGKKQSFKTLMLHVDDKTEFKNKIDAGL